MGWTLKQIVCLMERGSILMRNSERMRRGDELLDPQSALSQR